MIIKLLMTLLLAFVLFLLYILIVFYREESKPYQGPITDHFDGKHFHNLVPSEKGVLDVIKWMMTRNSKAWPAHVTYPLATQVRLREDALTVTFVNHSTVLIQVNGLNILTDPIWSERASPFSWMGPKRVHAPGIAFENLPPIDLVLVSHNHYDHFDLPTLERLKVKFNPLFITGLGNRRYLQDRGFQKVIELDWWQETFFKELKIIFVPAIHFAARGLTDRNYTLWGGFYLYTPQGRIYFAGDTAYGDFFQEIKSRLGPPDLAFLPIGAFLPRWFMKTSHMDPIEAIQAHRDLKAKKSIAIHYQTFHLSDEGYEDPQLELKLNLKKDSALEYDFLTLKPGQTQAFEKMETP